MVRAANSERLDLALAAIFVPNRIATSFVAKRLGKHTVEVQLAPIAELFDADGHRFVSGYRLVAVGPEQAIPPG